MQWKDVTVVGDAEEAAKNAVDGPALVVCGDSGVPRCAVELTPLWGCTRGNQQESHRVCNKGGTRGEGFFFWFETTPGMCAKWCNPSGLLKTGVQTPRSFRHTQRVSPSAKWQGSQKETHPTFVFFWGGSYVGKRPINQVFQGVGKGEGVNSKTAAAFNRYPD